MSFVTIKLGKNKSILWGTFLTLLILVVGIPLVVRAAVWIGHKTANRNSTLVKKVIDQQLGHLANGAAEIGAVQDLQTAIKTEDTLQILAILDEEKNKRNIEGASATNRYGIVLSRTHNITKRGDNVFVTTAQGRAVDQGRAVSSIETATSTPLAFVAGYPIFQAQTLIGAVFTGNTITDDYVNKLKKQAVDTDVQLAFYSKKDGIFSSTFPDPEDKNLIKAYFNTGIDGILQGKTNKEVRIDGTHYIVSNITFPGLEESPGGLLVFSPYYDALQNSVMTALLVALFIFVVLVVHIYVFKNEKRSRLFYILLLLSSLIVALTNFTAFQWITGRKLINVKRSAFPIYNSTLRFQPSSTIFDPQYSQSIGIQVDTGGESINAVKVVVNFDPKKVNIEQIVTNQSFCQQNLFIERTIDNTNGQVRVTCGLPRPGFSEASGLIAELIVKPLGEGEFQLKFNKETQVLANDGLGTNVLRAVTNGSYQITTADTPIVKATAGQTQPTATGESPETLPSLPKLVIFSPSHPNSELWYKANRVQLIWTNVDDADYRIALDQNPLAEPDESRIVSSNSLTQTVETDGTYYFHVAARRNGVTGPVSHFKLQIDTTPPPAPQVKASQTTIQAGEVVRLELAGADPTSGTQNSFYMRIDNQTFLPAPSQLYLPFSDPGKHTVTVRVFDNAGNFADRSIEITVRGTSTLHQLVDTFSTWIELLFR